MTTLTLYKRQLEATESDLKTVTGHIADQITQRVLTPRFVAIEEAGNQILNKALQAEVRPSNTLKI
ncbi:MAG: hypothetical protein U1E78_03175 [Gammaproteobacteria bacterium]